MKLCLVFLLAIGLAIVSAMPIDNQEGDNQAPIVNDEAQEGEKRNDVMAAKQPKEEGNEFRLQKPAC